MFHGYINLDKPQGMTSTQALGRLKRILNLPKKWKIGHAGTLDPMATGVLPIALGEATKTIEYIQDREKAYRFEIKWGEATDTDDADGTVTNRSDKIPTAAEIESALPSFVGLITQTPPAYSAIKIDGRRAYDLARKGEEVVLKPRQVKIHSLHVMPAEAGICGMKKDPGLRRGDVTRFEVTCGKGTYIRALARDLAIKLGTYGHLTALRRTKVGKMDEKSAISIDLFEDLAYKADPSRWLIPLTTALDDILVLPIGEEEAKAIGHGRALVLKTKADLDRMGESLNPLRLLVAKDKPIAIARAQHGQIKPVKVFNII